MTRHEGTGLLRVAGWIVLTVGVLCTPVSAVSAAVPHLIRYQGQAVDSKGVGLEGPYTLIFRLYDAPTGGTKVWEETQPNVPVSQGYFAVLLGSVKPLDAVDWSKSLWLGVEVDQDPQVLEELSPRQQMTSVPLAITAEQLSGPITTVGGNVGIGTTTPGGILHVVAPSGKRIRIEPTSQSTVGGDTPPFTIEGMNSLGYASPASTLGVQGPAGSSDGSMPVVVIYDSSALDKDVGGSLGFGAAFTGSQVFHGATIRARKVSSTNQSYGLYLSFETRADDNSSFAERMRITHDGKVGIGTTNPMDKLQVQDGAIQVTNSTDGAMVKLISSNAVGYGVGTFSNHNFSVYVNAVPAITIPPSGNVGIGTTSPQQKLDVAGYVRANGYYTGDVVFQKDNQPLWRMYEDERGLYFESLLTKKRYRILMQEIPDTPNGRE